MLYILYPLSLWKKTEIGLLCEKWYQSTFVLNGSYFLTPSANTGLLAPSSHNSRPKSILRGLSSKGQSGLLRVHRPSFYCHAGRILGPCGYRLRGDYSVII